jgi:hypothetical protein
MNFYLKNAERSHRGYEFTHKSFGEYLASRALISVAETVASDFGRRADYAMEDWLKATRSGTFNAETLTFLNDEVRLLLSSGGDVIEKTESAFRLKQAFEGIALICAVDGFPLSRELNSWKTLASEQANAECGVWTIINSCSRALRYVGELERSRVAIDWDSEEGWTNLLVRLGVSPQTSVITHCLANVELTNGALRSVQTHDADFSYSNLSGCVFVGCDLNMVDFSHANMEGARFYLCRVNRSLFHMANCKDMILHNSIFRDCDLSRASNKDLIASPSSVLSAQGAGCEDVIEAGRFLEAKEFDKEDMLEVLRRKAEAIEKMATHSVDNLVTDYDRFDPIHVEELPYYNQL